MIWALAGIIVLGGVAFIVWRDMMTENFEMFLGTRLHPGCSVLFGGALIAGVIVMYLLFLTGVIPVPQS